MSMQKWIDLRQEIYLPHKISEEAIMREAQLSNFESEMRIILPLEYKNYCQVLGSGMFGDLVRIHYLSLNSLKHYEKYLDWIREEMKRYPSKDKKKDQKISDWLDHVLIFASDDRGNIAAWDLNTYCAKTQEYDIFWIHADIFEDDIHKIESDFFQFITDFCMGKKEFDWLPKHMRTQPCDSFTSFKGE